MNTKRKRKVTGLPRNAKRAKTDTNEGKQKTEAPKKQESHRCVKLSFGSIIKEQYAAVLRSILFDRSYQCSEIMVLGSLQFLFMADKAIEWNEVDFFDRNGSEVIGQCFRSITMDNITDPLALHMNDEFKQLVEDVLGENFEWPIRFRLSQTLTYMIGGYETSVKNNLFYHCEKRLNSYLRVIVYEKNRELNTNDEPFDGYDIRNAKKNLLFYQDWTENDPERIRKMNVLVETVLQHCPSLKNNGTLYDYVEHHWFKSLYLFIVMQRKIGDYNEANQPLVQQWLDYRKSPLSCSKPSEKLPPKINSFTVIPLCHFKLHHIRFDHNDLVHAISQLDAAPAHMKGQSGKGLSLESRAYYMNNKDEAWSLLFDIEKINSLANRNRHQTFHHQIVCNSVDASIVYCEPKREKAVPNSHINEIRRKKENGYYKYYIPLDPGVKTKMAGIQINPITQSEVSLTEFFHLISI